MQYSKFIQKCLTKIKQQREIHFGNPIEVQQILSPQQPLNLYIELIGEKGNRKMKLEQWNFVCVKQMNESQFGEEQDSELDSVNMPQKSFFQVLTETLKNLNPKLLFKALQLQRLKIRVTKQEQELQLFSGEGTFLKQVEQYQTQAYCCEVSLKYEYENLQQVKIMSSDEEFELLVDESYEKGRIDRVKEKEERKLSQDIYARHRQNFVQTQTEMKEELMKKKRKKEMINQIKEIIKINQFQGKTLKQFIFSLH